ncbi:MAG: hypothetical protein IIY21_18320 [Clostridiales bacterium]|nr:hypothetical protein [Clostridiales bacterium]
MRFEVGKVYEYRRKVILDEVVTLYRCVKRTEKTAWFVRILDDGSDGCEYRVRIQPWGNDSEYVYKAGAGNPRSCWYSCDFQIFAKDVRE